MTNTRPQSVNRDDYHDIDRDADIGRILVLADDASRLRA